MIVNGAKMNRLFPELNHGPITPRTIGYDWSVAVPSM